MSLDQSISEQSADAASGGSPSSEMSGQWIREQLKDAADSPESNPPNPPFASDEGGRAASSAPSGSDDSLGPIMANLARNISEAVTKPIEDLERRRITEREHLGRSVREQAERVDAVFAVLRRLEEATQRLSDTVDRQENTAREQAEQANSRMEEVRSEARREKEAISESIAAMRGELEGFAGRLSNTEKNIEEHKSVIARLEGLEKRREEALTQVGRLVGDLQGALHLMSPPEGRED